MRAVGDVEVDVGPESSRLNRVSDAADALGMFSDRSCSECGSTGKSVTKSLAAGALRHISTTSAQSLRYKPPYIRKGK